jgi:hypothetical protein
MISGTTEPWGILSVGQHRGKKGENRTSWDFELRHELNRFVYLNNAIRCRIVHQPLKAEDENGWKDLNVHLLTRLT